jgi:hypothetical protein
MSLNMDSSMTAKRCLFCGSARGLTKEHIIPQWLLGELGLTDQQLRMRHISTLGMTRSQRTHSFLGLVNAMVCEECNSGWMSRLEVAVKDSITKLMHLDDVKNVLGSLADSHETIARWGFKTAIVLNYPTNYRNIVPEDHFHSLYHSRIPEGVYINLALTENADVIQWRQSQTVIMIGDREYVSRPKDVYKITMQFKHLLLRVCYVSLEDFTQGHENEASIALWPHFGRYKSSRVYDDIDEFDVSNHFVQV